MSFFSANFITFNVSHTSQMQSAFSTALNADNSEKSVVGTQLTTHIDELSVSKQIEDIEKRLNRLLLSHNIDTSQEINFKMSPEGRIVVNGNIKGKEHLERILNENPQFLNDVKSMLNNSHELATSKVQHKYSIALNSKDDDDEEKQETEFEKQLRLHEKAVSFQQLLTNASGNFSLSGAKISVASLNLAAGFSF